SPRSRTANVHGGIPVRNQLLDHGPRPWTPDKPPRRTRRQREYPLLRCYMKARERALKLRVDGDAERGAEPEAAQAVDRRCAGEIHGLDHDAEIRAGTEDDDGAEPYVRAREQTGASRRSVQGLLACGVCVREAGVRGGGF